MDTRIRLAVLSMLLLLTVVFAATLSYLESPCGPTPEPPPQITVVRDCIPPDTDIGQLYLYSCSLSDTDYTAKSARFILDATTDLELNTGQLPDGWRVEIDRDYKTRLANGGQVFTFSMCEPDTRVVPLLLSRLVVQETQGRAYSCILAMGEIVRPFLEQAGAGSPPVPAHNPGSSFLEIPRDIGSACQMMLSELDVRRQRSHHDAANGDPGER